MVLVVSHLMVLVGKEVDTKLLRVLGLAVQKAVLLVRREMMKAIMILLICSLQFLTHFYHTNRENISFNSFTCMLLTYQRHTRNSPLANINKLYNPF